MIRINDYFEDYAESTRFAGTDTERAAMPSSGVMISRELQITLQFAMTEALNRRHEYVCLEHVLYAMLHDVTTSNVLQHCGADLDSLRKKLQKAISTRKSSGWPRAAPASPITRPECSGRLQRAALHAQSAGRQEINGPARADRDVP